MHSFGTRGGEVVSCAVGRDFYVCAESEVRKVLLITNVTVPRYALSNASGVEWCQLAVRAETNIATF